nr:Ig-like domain-containing protein [Pseudomonas sp. P42]
MLGGIYAATRDDDKDNNPSVIAPVLNTPVVDGATDNVGADQGPITKGGSTDDTTPTFSGTGTPGNIIIIKDNDKPIGEVTIGDDGKWTFTPTTPLPEGEHSIIVIEKNKEGNVSKPSDEFDFIVDITAPGKSSIDGITDDFGPQHGEIAQNGLTDDNTPTLRGKAEPDSTLEIYANGVKIGETTVNPDGSWSYTPSPALADGTYEFTTVAKDAAGNVGLPSDPYVIIVDTNGPGKPGIGTGGIEEAIDNVGTIIGDIGNGGVTDDDTPTFSGGGLNPGDRVTIIDGGVVIGEAIVGDDGRWEFTPDPALSEGPHPITVIVTDSLDRVSEPSDPYIVIVDTTAPVKPGIGTGGIEEAIDNVGTIIGDIGNGGVTDDDTPTFSGGGLQPGDKVTIIDGGVEIGEAIVGDDGRWEFTPDPALTEGPHPITVIVTDPAGNASEPSDPYIVIVDTTAPVKPGIGTGGIEEAIDNVGTIIGDIGNGGVTDDDTPTFSGGGLQPGDKVTIIDGGVEIGEAIVGDDGRWEFTPDPALTEGPHPITVIVTDPAGNASEPSDPYIVIVDTTAPVKPGIGTGGIEEAIDNVGPITGDIGNGGRTDDGTPTFGGGGLQPGDKVTIIDGGVEIGEAIVGDDGRWEFTPDPALTEGPHPITVIVTDPAGNASEPSDPYIVIVDTLAPAAPTIDSVFDDQGTTTGPINSGDTTDDAQPLISGTAEAGSTVIIYDNGNEIGRTIANPDGSWNYTPIPPLLNGPHDLTAQAQDSVGNISDSSNNVDFDLVAGGTPPAPAINQVFDDIADGVGNIMPGGSTNDTEPDVSGTGEALSTINLFANGVLVGTTTADDQGRWSITPNPPLTEGLNNLTATATNAAGNESAPTGEYPINVDITPPAAADASELEDNVGAITGPITSGDTTDDNTPTFSGTAEPNTTLIIYDNGVEIDRVPVDGNGDWSFTPAPPLADGAHSFSTEVVDAAGNRSPQSTPIDFTVDTSAVAISIEQALDNVGPNQAPLASGGVTDDSTPTLTGQATPGSMVNIYLNGVLHQANVPVNAAGQWEYTFAPALAEGNHVFNASVVTPAGGESPLTGDFNLEVDLTASAAPTIDEIRDDVGAIQDPLVDGATTDDTTPTLVGSGVAGDTIIIRNNGVEIGRETVQPDGSWSFTPNPPLNNGTTNEFDVIAQDPAGNQSAPSDPWTIIIDTDAPTASAVIESMGKDSGADSGDFVTNDGSAGRLIQGSLTAALVAGEKVQVSTDGGATWLDVLMNADDTWNFLDKNSHTGDWTIQARVVDAAGNANTVSQAVTLDSTGPDAPDTFSFNGATVTVNFDGTSLSEGDTLQVVVGDQRFEVQLTQAQIDAGAVDVVTAPNAAMTNTSAAFIDSAGNISQYLVANLATTNFEGLPPSGVPASGQQDFGSFVFHWSRTGSTALDGILAEGTSIEQASGGTFLTPSTGIGVFARRELGDETRVVLAAGTSASAVSFDVGGLTSPITLIFRDAGGLEVHRVNLPVNPTGIEQVNFQLPGALAFTSIDFIPDQFADRIWLDNFEFSTGGFNHIDPPVVQDIDGAGSYYGDEVDNTFLLADVANLDNASSSIKGGGGIDTLQLTGDGQTLDLGAIAGSLESIEIIDITGTGNNTLNLSLGDVLELGEGSLFTEDETVQLVVKGNAGDVVNLDDLLADGTDPGDWAGQGQVTVEGVTYNVFQHSSLDAQLLVQDGVTTNLV